MMIDKVEDLRIKRGDETRRSLIQATITAVAQYGLSATTLNVVANIAGVSRALIGFHFSSKEQLLDAVLENALDTYDLSLKAYLAKLDDEPLTQVKGNVIHDIHFAATHSELLSLWFANWGEVRATKKYRLSLLPIDHKYRDDIANKFNKVLNNEHEAKVKATIIDNFIYGVWLECHLDPESYSLKEYLSIGENLMHLLSK
jgi:TetR/AcrR family transcriptional repressor of bet genes